MKHQWVDSNPFKTYQLTQSVIESHLVTFAEHSLYIEITFHGIFRDRDRDASATRIFAFQSRNNPTDVCGCAKPKMDPGIPASLLVSSILTNRIHRWRFVNVESILHLVRHWLIVHDTCLMRDMCSVHAR